MTKELRQSSGYAFVDIQPQLDRDREQRMIDPRPIDIKPGPRVYVERINITGNVRTLDEVIRREFRLAEGDPYNTALHRSAPSSASTISVSSRKSTSTTSRAARPTKPSSMSRCKEKSTGEINLGAGYSTTDGLLGDFGIKREATCSAPARN